MSHDVFICHSSKDRTIATAICSRLEQHRIRCWIAPRDVIPGSEYAQSIIEAIAATRLTVLVFSENSNRSSHVRREIERTASHGIPIVPFRVEDVIPSPSLEYFISDAHWLDALTPPVEQHLDYLVGTVRLLLDRETTANTATAESAAPAQAHPPVTRTVPSAGPTETNSPRGDGSAPSHGTARRRWLWAVLGAIGLLGAIVVGFLLLGRGDQAPVTTAPMTTPADASASTGPVETAPGLPPLDEEAPVPDAGDVAAWHDLALEYWAGLTEQQVKELCSVRRRDYDPFLDTVALTTPSSYTEDEIYLWIVNVDAVAEDECTE